MTYRVVSRIIVDLSKINYWKYRLKYSITGHELVQKRYMCTGRVSHGSERRFGQHRADEVVCIGEKGGSSFQILSYDVLQIKDGTISDT